MHIARSCRWPPAQVPLRRRAPHREGAWLRLGHVHVRLRGSLCAAVARRSEGDARWLRQGARRAGQARAGHPGRRQGVGQDPAHQEHARQGQLVTVPDAKL